MVDKEQLFSEAVSRGEEGKISNFRTWLSENQLDEEIADKNYIDSYYRNNPDQTVDLENEIQIIGEYIGYLQREERHSHLAVTGVKGSGKTQLVKVVEDLMDSMQENVRFEVLNASKFHKVDSEYSIDKKLGMVDETAPTVICVDNASEDKKIAEYTLRKINSKLDNFLLITVWDREMWSRKYEDVNEVIEVSDELYMGTMTQEETKEMLDVLVDLQNRDKISRFSQRIYDYSRGVPGLSLDLLWGSLRQAFMNGLEPFEDETVELVAGKKNLRGITTTLRNMSDTKKQILEEILLEKDSRGLRPTKLVKETKKDKSTISYHLQDLESKKILKKNKYGRSAFYRIDSSIKPLLELQITGEDEFYE